MHKRNEKLYKILVGKHEGKRLLERSSWKHNFKMDLGEIGYEDAQCIHLA
jgi:hypothetical protein